MADDNGQDIAVDSSQTVLSGSLDSGESPAVGQDGSAVDAGNQGSVELPKWTEQAPTEYRPKLAGYQTYKDFMKEATELLDRKDSLVTVPGEDASKDQWDQFYSSVGRPADPSGYGIESEDELVKEFQGIAHQSGLSVNQAKSIMDWYNDATSKQQIASTEAVKAQTETAQKELKEAWGGDYDKKMADLKRFGAKYGIDKMDEVLKDPAIGNNVALIQLLANAGKDLASERIVNGKPATATDDEDSPTLTYAWMRDAYPVQTE